MADACLRDNMIMEKIKVLIVEDEEAAAERLKKMISAVDKDIEILDTIVSIKSAVAYFKKNPSPDLIFLDIHLADGSSFEIFKQVEIKTPVIFTTAYDEFAINAFKVNSVDYLLKPLKAEDLKNAIDKYKNLFQKKESSSIDYSKIAQYISKHNPEYRERLVTRFGGLLKMVNISDAAYFYTENKVTYVRTKANSTFAIDETLEELEAILNPKQFFRINRQFIIAINSIEKMLVVSKSRVKLTLNPPADYETIASTERSSSFKKWLAGE
jgi:two-component system, LytTR family, response regulator LytT